MKDISKELLFLASQCAADIPLPLNLLQRTLKAADDDFRAAQEVNISIETLVQLPIGLLRLPSNQQQTNLSASEQDSLRSCLLDEAAEEAHNAMRHHSKLDQLTNIREIGPHLYTLCLLAQNTHHPRTIQLWIAFGDYLMAVGKQADALSSYRAAMAFDNQNPTQSTRDKLKLTRKLGEAAFALNDFDTAEIYFLSAAILAKQEFGKDSPKPANDYENLGKTAFKRGDLPKAIQLYQKALSIEETLGKNANLAAARHNNLGRVFQAAGQLEAALEHFNKAADLWQNEGASDHHINQALAFKNIGTVYQALGKFEKAQQALEKAISLSEAHYGPNHADIGRDANILALILQEQGKFDEALTQFRRALRIDIETFGMNHPEVALTLNNLGTFYGVSGNRPKAQETLLQAQDILQKCTHTDHPYRLQVEENLKGLRSL